MHPPRLACLGLVLAAFCLILGNLPAQEQLITKEQEDQFYNKVKFHFDQKVLTGQETANAQQIESAARYYVLRVTIAQAQTDAKRMADIVKHFEDMVYVATTSGNAKANRELINKFAPQLVKCFKEVFDLEFNDNRMAEVNAAVMLPHLAKLKHEDIGDFLASIVGDEKKHDAVRVHAAIALREYFPAKAFTKFDQASKGAMEKKLRDKQRVDALLKVIDRPMPATTDPYEIDGLRYVRWKAVKTLAHTQVPAISALDKKGNIEGPVALGLVKVLAKKVQPEPSLLERVDAATGVCQFTKYVDEYDPKIGIYLVGETLVDLVGEYKRDFNNITNKGKDRKPPTMYWKIMPKQLEVALGDLVNNTKGTSNAASVQALEAAARPVFKNMYNLEPIEREQQLRDVVQKLRPTTKTLFKNEKGPTLEYDWMLAAAEEKQAEEK